MLISEKLAAAVAAFPISDRTFSGPLGTHRPFLLNTSIFRHPLFSFPYACARVCVCVCVTHLPAERPYTGRAFRPPPVRLSRPRHYARTGRTGFERQSAPRNPGKKTFLRSHDWTGVRSNYSDNGTVCVCVRAFSKWISSTRAFRRAYTSAAHYFNAYTGI